MAKRRPYDVAMIDVPAQPKPYRSTKRCSATWSVGMADTHRNPDPDAKAKGVEWLGHRCTGAEHHDGDVHVCRCGAVSPPELPGMTT